MTEKKYYLTEHEHLTRMYPCNTGEITSFELNINHRDFIFIVEKTATGYKHLVTVDDLIKLISYLPAGDLENIKMIILKQPDYQSQFPMEVKLTQYTECGNYSGWAFIIYSQMTNDFEFPGRVNDSDKHELRLLKEEGHSIFDRGNKYFLEFNPEKMRYTQLFRHFLHKAGHNVFYLNTVERRASGFWEWEVFQDEYDAIPFSVKEYFALSYYNTLFSTLKNKKLLPFNLILNQDTFKKYHLREEDFFT